MSRTALSVTDPSARSRGSATGRQEKDGLCRARSPFAAGTAWALCEGVKSSSSSALGLEEENPWDGLWCPKGKALSAPKEDIYSSAGCSLPSPDPSGKGLVKLQAGRVKIKPKKKKMGALYSEAFHWQLALTSNKSFVDFPLLLGPSGPFAGDQHTHTLACPVRAGSTPLNP